MQESIYVGLDLGSSRCHQTVINQDGALLSSRVIPTSEQHLRSAFTALGSFIQWIGCRHSQSHQPDTTIDHRTSVKSPIADWDSAKSSH